MVPLHPSQGGGQGPTASGSTVGGSGSSMVPLHPSQGGGQGPTASGSTVVLPPFQDLLRQVDRPPQGGGQGPTASGSTVVLPPFQDLLRQVDRPPQGGQGSTASGSSVPGGAVRSSQQKEHYYAYGNTGRPTRRAPQKRRGLELNDLD